MCQEATKTNLECWHQCWKNCAHDPAMLVLEIQSSCIGNKSMLPIESFILGSHTRTCGNSATRRPTSTTKFQSNLQLQSGFTWWTTLPYRSCLHLQLPIFFWHCTSNEMTWAAHAGRTRTAPHLVLSALWLMCLVWHIKTQQCLWMFFWSNKTWMTLNYKRKYCGHRWLKRPENLLADRSCWGECCLLMWHFGVHKVWHPSLISALAHAPWIHLGEHWLAQKTFRVSACAVDAS